MATKERPGAKPDEKTPAPAPVDTSEESVAGEEDPGASLEDAGDHAFDKPVKPKGS